MQTTQCEILLDFVVLFNTLIILQFVSCVMKLEAIIWLERFLLSVIDKFLFRLWKVIVTTPELKKELCIDFSLTALPILGLGFIFT